MKEMTRSEELRVASKIRRGLAWVMTTILTAPAIGRAGLTNDCMKLWLHVIAEGYTQAVNAPSHGTQSGAASETARSPHLFCPSVRKLRHFVRLWAIGSVEGRVIVPKLRWATGPQRR